MSPQYILKLNAGGMPVDLIPPKRAVNLHAAGKVLYAFGEQPIVLLGGINGEGQRSTLELPSMMAVRDRSTLWDDPEPRRITRRALFERDRMCLYCGKGLTVSSFTVDHIVPRARGGSLTDPVNLCVACLDCNSRKGDRLPEEVGLKLLAVPYRPNPAARLLLSGRRIVADQMEYLLQFANCPKH